MNTAGFLIFIQLLTVGIVFSYGTFRVHFAKNPALQAQIKHLKNDIRAERIKTDLALEDFEEFKALVASELPSKALHDKKAAVRTIASVTQSQKNSDTLKEFISEDNFKKAKTYLSTGQYELAKVGFKEFIHDHSYSPSIIEAHFLLMESLSRLEEFEECTKVIETMIQEWPENEYTGFALIQLGEQFEVQGQKAKAISTYQTVIKSFPFHDVTTAAADKLRKVSL